MRSTCSAACGSWDYLSDRAEQSPGGDSAASLRNPPWSGRERVRWPEGGSPYRVVPAGWGAGWVGEGAGAPAVGTAGQRLFVRSTSGYQLSGSITTLLT